MSEFSLYSFLSAFILFIFNNCASFNFSLLGMTCNVPSQRLRQLGRYGTFLMFDKSYHLSLPLGQYGLN